MTVMDLAEVARQSEQADAELRAWDWHAALKADERSIPWLARKTGKSVRAVYDYRYGVTSPPIEWLRDAAAVLGKA